MFRLANSTDTPLKLNVIDPGIAVFHDSDEGPTFGLSDLHVDDLSNEYSINCIELNSYEFPEGKSGKKGSNFIVGGTDYCFKTVEIEVFQII